MAIPDLTATPEAVAALLRARTKDLDGNEAGAFSAETRPTLAEVQTLIAQAVALVTPRLMGPPGARLPDPWPQEFLDMGTAIVALRTALLIEPSYFPEQVEPDHSPHASLLGEYNAAVRDWDRAVRRHSPRVESATFDSLSDEVEEPLP